jgi:hypothetical protein
MEQRGPNRGALSVWEETNPVARLISRQLRVDNEIPISFRNVFDRVNSETPISSESGFPSSIDESQLYIHWFCGAKFAVIRSVYSHPSPVRRDSGQTGVAYTPSDSDNTHKREDGGDTGDAVQPFRHLYLHSRGGNLFEPYAPLYMFVAFFVCPILVGLVGLIFKNRERRFVAFLFAVMGLAQYAFFLFLSYGELWSF